MNNPGTRMRGTRRRFLFAACLMMVGFSHHSSAQHVTDNPVLSADDAFGLTLGIEAIGLYGASYVRGYSPQTAGNARIEGLYFDQQGTLSKRSIERSIIRVGLSEIDYSFPAPTGIVDYDLRSTGDGTPGASIIANAGPYDSAGISVDGTWPISRQLRASVGASYSNDASFPGYESRVAGIGFAPEWKPVEDLTFRAFFDWRRTDHAGTMPTVFTQDGKAPPRVARRYLGQEWAEGEFLAKNYGGLVNAKLNERWSLAAGSFRSRSAVPVSYADLYVGTEPSGLADHFVVGSPRQWAESTSGEIRLTGRFLEGKRSHDLVFLARGRDLEALYGGSDVVDVGSAHIGAGVQVGKPNFAYSSPTHDNSQLWSGGVAYHGRWSGHGELSLGIQQQFYEKSVTQIDTTHFRLTAARAYGRLAIALGQRVIAYGGYTQGLEDSGVAPATAQNRGTILPVARTWQVDAGLRYQLNSRVNLIAGLFEVSKPYFNFDANDIVRALGTQRIRGLELSASGALFPNLNVIAGAVLGPVEVIGSDLEALGVGRRAVGQPDRTLIVNIDYNLRRWPAWSLDFGLKHWGAYPATVNNAAEATRATLMNVGARYRFRALRVPVSARVQITNITNVYTWGTGFSPGYKPLAPRAAIAYLTVDL